MVTKSIHKSFFIARLIKGFMIILLSALAVGCEEDGPKIKTEPDPTLNPEDSISQELLKDTAYQAKADSPAQSKNVLIEDFTGVRCNNCPKATANIKSLQKDHGDRVIAVGIHSNKRYSRPYENSKENYRIEDGQLLYKEFGSPPQPAGMVDRYQFDGQEGQTLDYQRWESKAPERLKDSAKVNIYIKSFVRKNDNQILLKVKSHFQEDLSNRVKLTVVITEDKIIDYQLTPEEKVSDYEHNHVLRKMLTPYIGQRLKENPSKQEVIEKGFQLTIEDNWELENLNAIAFVHFSRPNHTVLQTQKITF